MRDHHPIGYVLIHNLTATGDCLVVAADFVTIDLNGFTISGDGTGFDSGIMNKGTRKGIVVRNGTITNFASAGINFRGTGDPVVNAASSVEIEQMRIIGNNVGLTAGTDVIVRNSVVSENLGDGINLGPGAVVTGTIASRNGATGITGALTGATIIGNTADGNGVGGILVGAFGGATVINNTARSNGVYGISVICPSNLIGNTATTIQRT